MRRTQRGFTLIEAVIAVALLLGVIGISLKWMATAQKDTQRTALVNQEAMEIAKLTTATQSYLKTTEGLSETEGEIFAIAPADLVAAGFLPSDFAKRPASGSNAPVSPMGQLYSITAALTADGYRALVVPTGTPNAGFLARAGVANTPQAIQEFSVSVMEKLRQGYNVTASVITKDTKSVNSAASGFSYDLSTFLASAPAVPTVVGMANFKELEPVVGGSDGGSGTANRACSMSVDTACPAGTSEQWTYTTCSHWGPDYIDDLPITTVNTAGGDVTITKATNNWTPGPPAPAGAYNPPLDSPNGQIVVRFSKGVGIATWGSPQFDSSRSSIMHASTCSGSTMVEFKPYTLTCSATGEVLRTYYNTVCGQWYEYNAAQGDTCSPGGYQFSPDTMYQAGLTDSTRYLEAVGVGGPIIPGTASYNGYPYIEPLRDSEPVVRTLSACPGSVNASPIKIRKKDLGGGKSFEYMDARAGYWWERVKFGDQIVNAQCSMSVLGSGTNYTPTAVTGGDVGSSACPTLPYKTETGSTSYQKGNDYFNLKYPASLRAKKLRMCCT